MKIAVIGLGGVGTAAAWRLARAGHSVVGLEQFRIDHDQGESFGGSRIIRRVYPDVLYTRLADGAYRLWRELERESGEELYVACGGLFFGAADNGQILATAQALFAAGVPFEQWDGPETARRFPAFRMRPGETGIYEAEAGFLRASSCVRAMAGEARKLGAELREETKVEAVESAPGGVRVRLRGGGTVEADGAVLCAGPWTARLLAGRVGRPLRVTRQAYVHLRVTPGSEALFRPGAMPVWIDIPANFYGFPEHDGIEGVKLASHDLGPEVDPDRVNRELEASVTDRIRAYARERLPGLSSDVTYEKVCLYDSTPNEDFVLGRVPGEDRLVVAAGTSGHGFKFLPLLGEIAAELAAGEDPRVDITRFAPE